MRASTGTTKRIIPKDVPGIADARALPDPGFDTDWETIVFSGKEQLVRTLASTMQLRSSVEFNRLPLHGIALLSGPPGTGKTSLARGIASELARTVRGAGEFVYVEIDPHVLVSASLGRSQQKVDDLFRRTLPEIASAGPTVLLFDEVETVLADRSSLSLDANPFDLHRSIDAALTGLDRLAQTYRSLTVLATTNYPAALDGALTSRADLVVTIPLPDATARRAILVDTLQALAIHWPLSVGDVVDTAEFEKAVKAADGLDGRQVRKAVAVAVGLVEDLSPAKLTVGHLLQAVTEAREELR